MWGGNPCGRRRPLRQPCCCPPQDCHALSLPPPIHAVCGCPAPPRRWPHCRIGHGGEGLEAGPAGRGSEGHTPESGRRHHADVFSTAVLPRNTAITQYHSQPVPARQAAPGWHWQRGGPLSTQHSQLVLLQAEVVLQVHAPDGEAAGTGTGQVYRYRCWGHGTARGGDSSGTAPAGTGTLVGTE